jgi:hypothetical protein
MQCPEDALRFRYDDGRVVEADHSPHAPKPAWQVHRRGAQLKQKEALSVSTMREGRCLVVGGADGLFSPSPRRHSHEITSGIDQSTPIVVETEQISNRRNSPLNSRAEISDGLGKRFFVVCRKNLYLEFNALRSLRIIEWERAVDSKKIPPTGHPPLTPRLFCWSPCPAFSASCQTPRRSKCSPERM